MIILSIFLFSFRNRMYPNNELPCFAEYGTSTQISTLGDVYSYGILLLELFTGKRPTDNMFNNDLSIHKYIAMALPEHAVEVSDPSLVLAAEAERQMHEGGEIIEAHRANFQQLNNREVECLVSVLKIGVSCSMPSPEDRTPISIGADEKSHRSRRDCGECDCRLHDYQLQELPNCYSTKIPNDDLDFGGKRCDSKSQMFESDGNLRKINRERSKDRANGERSLDNRTVMEHKLMGHINL